MTNRRFRIALRILAPWALLASLLACGDVEIGETSSEPPPQPVVAPTAPAEPPPAADPAPAAGGACSRVAACCRAYVSAMGGSVPTATCDAYNNVANMPEAACNSAMAGYRSGLSAMQKAVPTECNP